MSLSRVIHRVLALGMLALPTLTMAHEASAEDQAIGAGVYDLDLVDKSLYDFTTWVADLKRMNFIIGDDAALTRTRVTVISHPRRCLLYTSPSPRD